MNYSMWLEEALDQRGNAILVITRPRDGADAIIQVANPCFARMIRRQADTLIGMRFREIRGVVEQDKDWDAVITAMHTLTPLKLDMRLQVDGRQSWLGFELSFKSDTQGSASYGFLIGRDITESRRRALRENESQRLLASVFLRTSAPVVIVRSDGVIMMSNPAFQRLLGYTAEDVVGRNVESLTAPDFAEVALKARDQQFHDGERYEVHFETVSKTGTHVPVVLTSVLLTDTQDLRVVTLLPYLANPGSTPATMTESSAQWAATRKIGQVHAVSLAALKTLFGESWQRVALRAMMLAEQIIKRRVSAKDVFSRNDDGFMIWFESPDADANEVLLEKIVREIRLRFLEDFGKQKAEAISVHVTSALVKATAETSSPEAYQQHRQSSGVADMAPRTGERTLKFAGPSPAAPPSPGREGVPTARAGQPEKAGPATISWSG